MQHLMPVLFDASIKGFAVLLLAWIVVSLMRRSSAAARHMVWSGAIVAVLAMPALSYVLPGLPFVPRVQWLDVPPANSLDLPTASTDSAGQARVQALVPPVETTQRDQHPTTSRRTPVVAGGDAILPAMDVTPMPSDAADHAPNVATAPPSSVTSESEDPTLAPVTVGEQASSAWTYRLRTLVPWLWLVGCLLTLVRLPLGWLSLWQLRRTASPVTVGPWHDLLRQLTREIGYDQPVVLLKSHCRSMPMTWGALSGILPGLPAAILIPHDADDWSSQRQRAVLLHELAHIKRRDCLAQLLTHLACGLYWFNPLVWLAARHMLVERERACDDMVLTRDTKASDYAQHLLDIATAPQTVEPGFFAANTSIAMARKSKLDGRLVAILDQHRNRKALTRAGTLCTLGIIIIIAVPMAMLKAGGQAAAIKDADTRPMWSATLTNDVEARLLGVTSLPTGAQAWWLPDGSPLAEAPYTTASSYTFDGWEIAVELLNVPANDVAVSIGVEGMHSPDFEQRVTPNGQETRRIYGVLVQSRGDAPRHVPVFVRVASGPWQPVFTTDGKSMSRTERHRYGTFEFSAIRPGGEHGRVNALVPVVTIAKESVNWRAVAIAADGAAHLMHVYDVSDLPKDHPDYKRATSFLYDLPIDEADVVRFEIQVRPFRQVRFNNVALALGAGTEVQVDVADSKQLGHPDALVEKPKEVEDAVRLSRFGRILADRPAPKIEGLRDRAAPDVHVDVSSEAFYDILKLRDLRLKEAVPELIAVLEANRDSSRIHRFAAEQALFAIGTPQAHEALRASMLRANYDSVNYAFKCTTGWEMPEPDRGEFIRQYLLHNLSEDLSLTVDPRWEDGKDGRELVVNVTATNVADQPIMILRSPHYLATGLYLESPEGVFAPRQTYVDFDSLPYVPHLLAPGESFQYRVALVLDRQPRDHVDVTHLRKLFGDNARIRSFLASDDTVLGLSTYGDYRLYAVIEQREAPPNARAFPEAAGVDKDAMQHWWTGRAVSKPVTVSIEPDRKPAASVGASEPAEISPGLTGRFPDRSPFYANPTAWGGLRSYDIKASRAFSSLREEITNSYGGKAGSRPWPMTAQDHARYLKAFEQLAAEHPDDPVAVYAGRWVILVDRLAGRADALETARRLTEQAQALEANADPEAPGAPGAPGAFTRAAEADTCRAYAAVVLARDGHMLEAAALFRQVSAARLPQYAWYASEMTRSFSRYAQSAGMIQTSNPVPPPPDPAVQHARTAVALQRDEKALRNALVAYADFLEFDLLPDVVRWMDTPQRQTTGEVVQMISLMREIPRNYARPHPFGMGVTTNNVTYRFKRRIQVQLLAAWQQVCRLDPDPEVVQANLREIRAQQAAWRDGSGLDDRWQTMRTNAPEHFAARFADAVRDGEADYLKAHVNLRGQKVDDWNVWLESVHREFDWSHHSIGPLLVEGELATMPFWLRKKEGGGTPNLFVILQQGSDGDWIIREIDDWGRDLTAGQRFDEFRRKAGMPQVATPEQRAAEIATAEAKQQRIDNIHAVSTAFNAAMEALYEGKPRQDVAAMFTQASQTRDPADWADESRRERHNQLRADAAELAEMLTAMAAEEAQWGKPLDEAALAALPIDDRIVYHIRHLRDVAVKPWMVPGKVDVLGLFMGDHDSTGPAVALRQIGKPAVPALLQLLTDNRPIRSISQDMNGTHVLRYQDAALQILEAIAGQHFDARSGRGQYLANAKPDDQDAIRRRANQWWADNQHMTEAQWLRQYLDGLTYDQFYRNNRIIDRLIDLEGQDAVDTIEGLVPGAPLSGFLARSIEKAQAMGPPRERPQTSLTIRIGRNDVDRLTPIGIGFRRLPRDMDPSHPNEQGDVHFEAIAAGAHRFVVNGAWPNPTFIGVVAKPGGGVETRDIRSRQFERQPPQLGVSVKAVENERGIRLWLELTNPTAEDYTLLDSDLALVSADYRVLPVLGEPAVGKVVPAGGNLTVGVDWNSYIGGGIWMSRAGEAIDWRGPVTDPVSGLPLFRATVAGEPSSAVALPLPLPSPETPSASP